LFFFRTTKIENRKTQNKTKTNQKKFQKILP